MQKNFFFISILFMTVAFFKPDLFNWARDYVPYIFAVILFGIGLSAEISEFLNFKKNILISVLAVLGQFGLAPLIALGVGNVLHLPAELINHLVILGMVATTKISPVMTQLSKGNTSLSIVMGLIITLLTPFLAPLALDYAFGTQIEIDYLEVIQPFLCFIFLPFIAGIIFSKFLKSIAKELEGTVSVFSSISVAFVIGILTAVHHKFISQTPMITIFAVFIYTIATVMVGYFISKIFRLSNEDGNALTFEIGIQSSILGGAITTPALKFTYIAIVTIFTMCQDIIGVIMSKVFSVESKSFKK